MKLHTVRFEFRGHAEAGDGNVELRPDLDIADEFSRLSRSLGFETPSTLMGVCGRPPISTTTTLFSGGTSLSVA